MISENSTFVKGNPTLSRFQQQVLARAFEDMGLILPPYRIHSLLLHNQQDNYYEVLLTNGRTILVHRPSLKRTLKRIREYAHVAA